MLSSAILLNFPSYQSCHCDTAHSLGTLRHLCLCLSKYGWTTLYHIEVWQVFSSHQINHAELSKTTEWMESKAGKQL